MSDKYQDILSNMRSGMNSYFNQVVRKATSPYQLRRKLLRVSMVYPCLNLSALWAPFSRKGFSQNLEGRGRPSFVSMFQILNLNAPCLLNRFYIYLFLLPLMKSLSSPQNTLLTGLLYLMVSHGKVYLSSITREELWVFD